MLCKDYLVEFYNGFMDYAGATTKRFADVEWDMLIDGEHSVADCLYDYAEQIIISGDRDAIDKEVEELLDIVDYTGLYLYAAYSYIYDMYEDEDEFEDDLLDNIYDEAKYFDGSVGLNGLLNMIDNAYIA